MVRRIAVALLVSMFAFVHAARDRRRRRRGEGGEGGGCQAGDRRLRAQRPAHRIARRRGDAALRAAGAVAEGRARAHGQGGEGPEREGGRAAVRAAGVGLGADRGDPPGDRGHPRRGQGRLRPRRLGHDGEYLLLCSASRLSVTPTADLWITGIHAETPYLRGLLDKIGVVPDFLTCGDYKTAAEMFMRTGPSKEADEMTNWLLDGMYDVVGQPDRRRAGRCQPSR